MNELTTENQEILKHLINLEKQGNLQGEFKNIPDSIYHNKLCPGFSRSDLNLIWRSYSHYEAAKNDQSEPAKALKMGISLHDLILLPEEFEKKNNQKSNKPTIIIPSFGRTKEEQLKKADWIEKIYKPFEQDVIIPWAIENDNKTQWPDEDWNDLMGMKYSLDNHINFQALLTTSEIENTYFWKDSKTGILLRARPDMTNKRMGFLIDLKSSYDASMNGFSRAICQFDYDFQSALYLYVASNCLKEIHFQNFVFAVVEKSPPYAVALYDLDHASLEVGKELMRKKIDKLHDILEGKCEKTYPNNIQAINLPHWGYFLDNR